MKTKQIDIVIKPELYQLLEQYMVEKKIKTKKRVIELALIHSEQYSGLFNGYYNEILIETKMVKAGCFSFGCVIPRKKYDEIKKQHQWIAPYFRAVVCFFLNKKYRLLIEEKSNNPKDMPNLTLKVYPFLKRNIALLVQLGIFSNPSDFAREAIRAAYRNKELFNTYCYDIKKTIIEYNKYYNEKTEPFQIRIPYRCFDYIEELKEKISDSNSKTVSVAMQILLQEYDNALEKKTLDIRYCNVDLKKLYV